MIVCPGLPITSRLLPLSERLSPKTTSEVYGLAAAGTLASATAARANAGSALPKNACFIDVSLSCFLGLTRQHCIASRLLRQQPKRQALSRVRRLRCTALHPTR